jgi:hypothetical protein
MGSPNFWYEGSREIMTLASVSEPTSGPVQKERGDLGRLLLTELHLLPGS